MKQNPSKQLKLYRELTKCHNLAEVQLSYQSKVKARDREKILSSHDSYEILLKLYDPARIEYVEHFTILLLNRSNQVLGWSHISHGGISGTIADRRVIFQAALLSNATAVILCHNHPSGNLNPSSTDIQLTKEIVSAGRLLDIEILDHVIISPDAYYSFADEGMIC